MTTTYTDIEQISETSAKTMIVLEDEDEKFKEQRFLNIVLCLGFLLFCLFMLVLIQFNFFSY